MLFQILGPVGRLNEQRVCVPPLPKVRQLFALLLSRYNHTVGTESFIDELWNENPPRSVMTTLQTYVYHLRKWLDQEHATAASGCLLITRPRGYALVGADDQLDAHIFEGLLAEGRTLLTEGKSLEAGTKLRDALSLWQGDPFANVTHGRLLEARVVYLEEIKVEALQLRVLADVNLNRHRELIPVLRSAVSDYPFNEWFYGLLMYSLNESGRRVEALKVYQNLRRLLTSELGVEPSSELQRLHQRILTADDRVIWMPPQFVANR